MELADIQQGMSIVEIVVELIESGVSPLKEEESQRVAFVLLCYMRQTGVDTSAEEWIVNVQVIRFNIMACSLNDRSLVGEITTKIIMGFG